MLLKVLTDNAPELLAVSLPVEDPSSMKDLAADLIETMVAYRGIGIAAPQVGVNKRLVVVLTGGVPLVMANPRIATKSGFYVSTEGCLSVPNRRVKKTRSKSVLVEYQDMNNERRTIRLHGIEAACIQHEIDHLDGKLIA